MAEKAVRKTAAKKTARKTTRKTAAKKTATSSRPARKAVKKTTTKTTRAVARTAARTTSQAKRKAANGSTPRKAPTTVNSQTAPKTGHYIRLGAIAFLMIMLGTSIAIGVSDSGTINVPGDAGATAAVSTAAKTSSGKTKTILPARRTAEHAAVNGGLTPAHRVTKATPTPAPKPAAPAAKATTSTATTTAAAAATASTTATSTKS